MAQKLEVVLYGRAATTDKKHFNSLVKTPDEAH